MTTYDWTGTGGNALWSNADNWSPNSDPPQTPDTAVIGTDDNSVVVNGASGVGTLDLGFFVFPQTAVGSTLTDNGANFDVDGGNIFDASTLQSETGGTMLFDFDGTLANSGTVLLGQVISGSGGSSNLYIDGAVTLTGGGTVDMGQDSHTFEADSTANIENDSGTSDSLTNQNNTISGAGSIVLGAFDNQADGTVEASEQEGAPLQIAADTFSNEGAMVAESRTTLDLGQDGQNGSLTNTGIITVQDFATLAISGDFEISGDGGIQLGSGNDGQIGSDGTPAVLTLIGQSLKGAGTLGDNNLTLDNVSNIVADIPNEVLTVDTGSNTVTNDGTLAAINNGVLGLASPVDNVGTIEANGGEVVISAPVSRPGLVAIGPNPAIAIGTDGTMVFYSSVDGDVTFTGFDAELILHNSLSNGGIGGGIVGAEATDSIDFFNVPYAPSIQAIWQQNGATGTLSLIEGGSTLASVVLAGQYINGEFSTQSDGGAGTLVGVPNPIPPNKTTAVMFTSGDSSMRLISDIGGNSILNAYAWDQVGPEWQVVGIGDFSGQPDETDDVMMYDGSTGQFEAYDISNNNLTNAVAAGQIGVPWSLVTFGDFSGNPNETDMLMDEPAGNGQLDYQVFDISNNQIVAPGGGDNVGQPGDLGFFGPVGSAWQVVGTGDFSSNPGETDVMMYDSGTGQFEVYDINDNRYTGAALAGQIGVPWSFVTFGDFSGNPNETDMLMDEPAVNGELDYQVFDIRNDQIVAPGGGDNVGQPGDVGFFGPVGPDWQVVGTGDFSGNPGETDVMMRVSGGFDFEVFDISHNQYTGAAAAGQIGPEWQVNGFAADPPSAAPSQLAQSMASYAPGNGVIGTNAVPDQTTAQTTTASPLAAHS